MRLRVALATAALGAAALIGLTACGPADIVDPLSPEATALSAMGYNIDDVTTAVPADDPTPSASAAPDGSSGATGGGGSGTAAGSGAKPHKHRPAAIRRALARNVEHGEVVVQTKKGDKTVDVQRGTVTAITDTSVTVKSADGFTQTWAFGTPLHVIEHRNTVQPSAVKVGAQIGLAGAKNGSTVTANLIVLPQAK